MGGINWRFVYIIYIPIACFLFDKISFSAVLQYGSDSDSTTITGLHPGKTYNVTVSALLNIDLELSPVGPMQLTTRKFRSCLLPWRTQINQVVLNCGSLACLKVGVRTHWATTVHYIIVYIFVTSQLNQMRFSANFAYLQLRARRALLQFKDVDNQKGAIAIEFVQW